MTVHDGCFAYVVPDDGVPALLRVSIDPREPIAAVGSGDAFLAGYVSARYSGQPAQECLRFAVACGTDSTQKLGAGVIDPRGVEKLQGEVRVERLALPAEVG
jgi:1-phosphofructokinase/tagatose 6-phosphate kinase